MSIPSYVSSAAKCSVGEVPKHAPYFGIWIGIDVGDAAAPRRRVAGERKPVPAQPRGGAVVDPAALLDFCATRMARFAVPRYVELRRELPKTPTERPRYADLKAEGVTQRTWDSEASGYRLLG
ncbi:MAG: hypothetical protein WEB06_16380 [Actinomycetota bacterium]